MALETLIPSKVRTGIAALTFTAGEAGDLARGGVCRANLGRAEMRYGALIIVVAALMLPAPAARAITMTFGGILSGANETPPNNPPGAGSVAVVLDPTAETIQIIASFFGLTTPDIMAHIHCCAPLGTNAGVATTLPAFAGWE